VPVLQEPQVRLISEEGEQLGVLTRDDALAMAREKQMDLVEVAPEASPPVCRIMDYGKHKYRQKKKEQQSRHKGYHAHLKEVRLSSKIEPHDLEVKLIRAREFLEKRDKVLVSLRFRGREIQHTERGFEIVSRFVANLEDVAKVERPPKREGMRITATLAPRNA